MALLAKDEHQEWIEFLSLLNNNYETAANLMLKREVSKLQTEIIREDLDPPLFVAPVSNSETFH